MALSFFCKRERVEPDFGAVTAFNELIYSFASHLVDKPPLLT